MTTETSRRDFLAASGAALTTSLFTGSVKGANDRVSAAFIGVGRMGQGNLGHAMKQPGLQVAAICDVYQPNLERAVAAAAQGRATQPREVQGFPRDSRRQIHRHGEHLHARSLARPI